MILGWTSLIILLGYFKVLTKNAERHVAENVMLALLDSDQPEMIDVMRSMVPQLSATTEIVKSFLFGITILMKPVAFFYNLLNFQTAVVDARTPDVTILWATQKQIYELRDFDSLDAFDLWNDALKRDVSMLVLLLGSVLVALTILVHHFAG